VVLGDGGLGLCRALEHVLVTTPQAGFGTGERHEGYRQDAMFARR
jgi:hypothetical protein